VPPEYVLNVADALGVSVDPLVAPLLQRYKDALYGPEGSDEPVTPAAVVPPPEPPRPRPDPAQLRVALDAVVYGAADAMNVTANDLRAAIDRALAASEALGGTLEDTRGAVAVKPGKRKV
jgi:hypothetical protein